MLGMENVVIGVRDSRTGFRGWGLAVGLDARLGREEVQARAVRSISTKQNPSIGIVYEIEQKEDARWRLSSDGRVDLARMGVLAGCRDWIVQGIWEGSGVMER
jgi:hypothetical protein